MNDSTVRSFALSGGQVMFNRVLSLVSFVVLARLLTPTAYGLAALANVFVMLFSAFAAGGFGQALVQRKHIDRVYINTTFWISVTVGVVMATCMVCVAYPLASVLDQPRLAPVLVVLSINFIVIGLSSTTIALLQRSMQFGKLAKASVIANIIATATGVAFAYAGFGVWALVVQTVLTPSITGIVIWRFSTFRPEFCADRRLVRPIVRVSRQFLGATLTDFLGQRADDFLVGARLGTTILGIYAVAYRMISVILDILANSVKLVSLPAFAKLQGDEDRLRAAYDRALGVSASVVMPCFAFLLAGAPILVEALFGSKWSAAVPTMRVLCLFGALEAVMIINGVFLQAIGAAHVQFRLTLAGTALQVLGFFVAVRFGLVWVAAAYVARAYLLAPIGLKFAAVRIGTTVPSTLRRIAPPAVCAGVMGVTVWAADHVASVVPDVARILFLIGVGVLVYLLLLRLVSKSHIDDLGALVRSVRRSRPRHPAVKA